MTPHQAMCHLWDTFEWSLGRREPEGDIPAPKVPAALMRFLALRTPIPWPKGVPTMKETDQERRGTPPEDFEADRARLHTVIDEFAGRSQSRDWPHHPIFLDMSTRYWGIWGYRHSDHHLRQFGC